jgi:hypothetical protein
MVPGAFVRVLFPTSEKPRQPGLLHIGYVLGVTSNEAMVAYTTSQPWPAEVPLPAGARVFTLEEAARLNQSRALLLRLDVLAKLPLTPAWFPDLARPGQGLPDRGLPDRGMIAVAPASLQVELVKFAANLARRRRELMQLRGP